MSAGDSERGARDGAAVTLFWTSALIGPLLPVAAMMLGGRRSPAQVLAEFWWSFIGAEPGLVIAAALQAIVFWGYAVFVLLHLGRVRAEDTPLGARRLGGVLGALALAVGTSLWANVEIFSSRSSTASIGFIFVPAYLVGACVLGYALGRLLMRAHLR